MDKKKSVIMWVLLSIAVVLCFVLAMYIVMEDKNPAGDAGLNASKDSNAVSLDFSGHYARTGYLLKEDSGMPFLLEEGGCDYVIRLDTLDQHMFSELKSGDFIMIATDEGMDDVDPPSIPTYACVLLKKGTESKKSLPAIQKAIEEAEEYNWTFEKYWRE